MSNVILFSMIDDAIKWNRDARNGYGLMGLGCGLGAAPLDVLWLGRSALWLLALAAVFVLLALHAELLRRRLVTARTKATSL